MLKDLQLKWTSQLKTLSQPIKHCKICFKPIKNPTFFEIFKDNECLCRQCKSKLSAKFIKFDLDGYDGLSLYEYDDNVRSLLYQFKGCYDYELKDIFLYRYAFELSILYKGYTVIPVPSYILDDENREFNHVVEMFKCVNLPILNIVKKISPFKQAEHTKRQREGIKDHLVIEKENQIHGKKVLLVDDVLTTGSTMKAMVGLVQKGKPKTIKILVMSKRQKT